MRDEDYEWMLDALPEEFYKAYGQVHGLLAPGASVRNCAEFVKVNLPWPPRQEDLWKMLLAGIKPDDTIHMECDGDGWTLLRHGDWRTPGSRSHEREMLLLWGRQHGYAWDGRIGQWVKK